MKFTNRQVTVLDIQDRHVRCSQLKYQDKKWSIRKSLQEDLQFSDRDQDANQDTANTIKAMLQEIGASKYLIVSISGRDVSIKMLSLPPMNDKKFNNIDGMLRYELGPQLPMDMDQMYHDYQIVEIGSQMTKILTASIKRSVLTRYIDILSQSGVYPDVMTISSTALFNAFMMNGTHITDQLIGLVCLRESTGDVVMLERGHLTYARSFNISENNTIWEINSTFDAYFKTRLSKSELDQMPIYLINSGEEIHHLDLTSVTSNVSANLQWHTLPYNCNFTSGLAMSGVFNSAHSQFLRINLLKQVVQEERNVRKKEAKARLLRLTPAISIIMLIIISSTLWWQSNKAKNNLHTIEMALKSNMKQLNDTSVLKDTAKKLDKQIESLSWVTEEYPMVSYRLYRIIQMVPDNLWLKEIHIPEVRIDKKKKPENPISKMYISGYAYKQDQIALFLDNLRRCDCFSDVKQESASEITLIGEKVLEFEIGLTSSKYTINQLVHTNS